MITIPGWADAKWETLADGTRWLVWKCLAFRDIVDGEERIYEVVPEDLAVERKNLAAFCRRAGCDLFEVTHTATMTPVAL